MTVARGTDAPEASRTVPATTRSSMRLEGPWAAAVELAVPPDNRTTDPQTNGMRA